MGSSRDGDPPSVESVDARDDPIAKQPVEDGGTRGHRFDDKVSRADHPPVTVPEAEEPGLVESVKGI